MGKFLSFILCVILFGIGVTGSVVEICRMAEYSQAMTDERWIGEVLLVFIYGSMAVGSAVYAVHLWRKKY